MASLRIALLQLPGCGADEERALAEGFSACRAAAARGADVALFPELWQVGYRLPPADPAERAAYYELATAASGPFVSAFRELAHELDMAIAVTYLERWPGAPRNSATLIDRHGELALTYAKVHTCDFGPERLLTPGCEFPVAELDTAAGPVRVGMMICFDREQPESCRALMLGGAELVLTPNACELDDERIGQFRARAFENMVALAMANYPAIGSGGHPPECNGRSVAFSGICYDERSRPLDQQLVQAGLEPGIFVAELDLGALRDYRAREPWGAAYRKPLAYGAIAGPAAALGAAGDASSSATRGHSAPRLHVVGRSAPRLVLPADHGPPEAS